MRPLRRIAPQLVVLVSGVALAAAATQVPAQDPPADLHVNARSAGKVAARALGASDAAGFQLAQLVPGDKGTGTVSLENGGGTAATYDLLPDEAADVAGRLGGVLSRQLELVVRDVTGGGSKLLFAGKLATLREPIALGEIGAGRSRTLQFDVEWPDGGEPATLLLGDNLFTGARIDVVYRFRVTRPDAAPAPAPEVEPVVPVTAAAPSSRECVSRRRFPIRVRVPRGLRVLSTRIFVDGRRVRVLKGRRLRAMVDLRGKRVGTFKVELAVRVGAGRTLIGTRRYRTCLPASRSSRPSRPPRV